MNKIILDKKEYSFNAASKTVTLYVDESLISKEALLLITNVTSNKILYNFGCDGYGGTISNNVITLQYDTTDMSDLDSLQILMQVKESSSDKLLKSIESNTSSLNEIVRLLTEQNELIKEMF